MKLKKNKLSAAGFSLVELMVVVIVIAILASLIIPQFVGQTHEARISTAKGQISELDAAVERFYINMDRYPTAEEGLKVLVDPPVNDEGKKWRGPYIKQLRDDPWGHPIQYAAPGTHHTTTFDIWSRGADGADGGDGENADIGNW